MNVFIEPQQPELDRRVFRRTNDGALEWAHYCDWQADGHNARFYGFASRTLPDSIAHMESPYQREFPDFPADDMPAIPQGFEDSSWHNDMCPQFINESAGLIIYVDYADAEKRDFPETPRFSVAEWKHDSDGRGLFASDDWAEVEAYILARAFAAQLAVDIGADNVQKVVEINDATGQPCASHEFCDANMTMDAAWQSLGFEPMPFAENGGPSDAQIQLWNRAWDIAVASRFFTESGK